LSGFKVIRGGLGFASGGNPNGGGIRIINSSPTIYNTWVYSCTGNLGGGVYINGGAPTFNNVPVWNSLAGAGGGFYINSGTVTLISNPLDISSGTVLWNHASAAGGGFYIGNATVTMIGLHIYGNSAETAGGIDIYDTSNKITLYLNAISANTTELTGGGGIEARKATNLDVFANYIGDPIIGGNVSHGDGGGAFFLESAGSVRNNWFIRNQANDGYGGAAAFCFSSPNLYFSNNWVEGNTAGRDGGGLSLFGNADPKIDGNTIVSNTARRGAGIDISEAGMVSVTNNIIARNVSNGPLPTIGGIEVLTTTARIINNTIADNTGDAVWFQNSHGIVIVNNILYGNSGYSVYGDTSIHTPYYTVGYNDKYANSYDAYHDVPTGGMDMNVNPQFKTSGDMFNYYHLLRTSPVLTTGSLYWAPYRDIDRDVRRCLGTVSMGADDLPCSVVYAPSLLR
jgi:parallel beta-helix repeat protein